MASVGIFSCTPHNHFRTFQHYHIIYKPRKEQQLLERDVEKFSRTSPFLIFRPRVAGEFQRMPSLEDPRLRMRRQNAPLLIHPIFSGLTVAYIRRIPSSTRSLFSHTHILCTSSCAVNILCVMADGQQPAVQRPRADQGAINAAQAVLPQVEPPAAAEPAPLPQENPNPPPEQLEVFLHFLVLLFPRFSLFPPCILLFYFSLYAFLLGFAFLFASFVFHVIHICFLSSCLRVMLAVFISALPRFYTCLSHIPGSLYFFRSPLFFFPRFVEYNLVYISRFIAFYARFVLYFFLVLSSFVFIFRVYAWSLLFITVFISAG